MGKLVESTFLSLDGVIGEPQRWGPPYWDEDHGGYATKLLFAADSLLLGRVTYEGFAQVWPTRSGDEYSDRINSMPKYVASRTLEDATWNATILRGDVADEVERLKQSENLLKFGTGEVDRALLERNLVDELHFWLFPVIAGSGQRLLEGFGFDLTHLELVDSDRFDSGLVVLTYTQK